MVAGRFPHMDLHLSGKRIAVTGGSRGLGLGCARALTQEGAKVAIGGRDPRTLEAVADELADVIPVVADLTEPGGASRFVETAVSSLGGLDGIVLNGGGPPAGTATSHDDRSFTTVFDDVAGAAMRLVRAALPRLRESQGPKSIVAITSVAAKEPIDGLAASSVARAGLTAYLRLLATELGPEGIRVNSVAPGYHDTERLRELGVDLDAVASRIPLGRLGDPDDLGAFVAFLMSDRASSITGQAIVVDGGALKGLF
jgi:3-oxoacyl-[acyl-carrier protein] reductase